MRKVLSGNKAHEVEHIHEGGVDGQEGSTNGYFGSKAVVL